MVEGFRRVEATVLSTFKYSSILFAALFGFLFWGEILDLPAMLGAILIVVSGVAIVRYRHKAVPTLARCAEIGGMHVHAGQLHHIGTANIDGRDQQVVVPAVAVDLYISRGLEDDFDIAGQQQPVFQLFHRGVNVEQRSGRKLGAVGSAWLSKQAG